MVAMLRRLRRFFCRHPSMYMERRAVNGYHVIHLVCPDCPHAVPAVKRDHAEHAAAMSMLPASFVRPKFGGGRP